MANKVKVLIIDDENLAREIIRKYLEDKEEISIAGECSNGFEGIKIINEEKPDIVFLDIQMPKITGFEMLELIDDPPVIIFTTAFDQYALKAFEVNAADYLLKPFSKERFDESIEKAFRYMKNKSLQQDVIKNLIKENDGKAEFLERIIIKDGSKITILPLENIKFIQAQDDYVMIHSTEGKFLKQRTMKYFEDHLDPNNFVRTHRSFIVPVKRIKRIELAEKNSYQIKLDDATNLPVSKSGYDKLKEVLR
ncbi:MAG TPA: response regulator [Ignavibacteriaceae bacterium]|nr:response regulator [Ignavibacteriaceae bacterium]